MKRYTLDLSDDGRWGILDLLTAKLHFTTMSKEECIKLIKFINEEET